jgi:hypothetical protein
MISHSCCTFKFAYLSLTLTLSMSVSVSPSVCQVLDALLSAIRKLQPPEKVVVVSNFTTTLDAIEVVLQQTNPILQF